MSSSQKWLDQKFSSIKSPFHFFHHCWRERKGVGRWTSCLGPCWPCIFKQAKSRSSPFFSEAIYPPKSMFTVQQPGKNEKFRPGSYLSPPSNAAILFYCKYLQGLWEAAKTGNPKGLAGPSELRGVHRKAFGGLFWFWPRAAREMPSGFG